MTDDLYMQTALALAEKGRGYTSPNPMVGAVVVKNGRVVGQGFHEAAGKPHAEVNAIDDAGSLAAGATLYVTLEPCNHTGRTPPCTEKIRNANISRVVVAMKDPNPHVRGHGIEYLSQNGIAVSCGVCKAEARRLNESFIKYVRTGRPFVSVKCAATLDGQIATRTGDARWVTNTESRRHVHWMRHGVDAILVGMGTVSADDPELTTRLETGRGLDPIRVILDTRLSIGDGARVLRLSSDSDTLIVTGPSVPEVKKKQIFRPGVRHVQIPLNHGRIDLDVLMDRLGAMGITSLLIEGGGRVIASALASGIVDKVFFFYAPKILGGSDGVPMCRGTGPDTMNRAIPVADITVRQFGADVLIEGYVNPGVFDP
jgi:diaminohydroxyphosphoribosylaminopyrimidine deaminase / 5-amino-6-(5-phosphoribosylamino)uracil reductase